MRRICRVWPIGQAAVAFGLRPIRCRVWPIGQAAVAVLLLLCAAMLPAGARGVPAGAGTVIFGDVPVAPGIFPDYAPHQFGLRGNPNVKPQTFSFATYADVKSVLAWYRSSLAAHGWHLDQTKVNYPVRGASAIVASRSGEAVTIIVEGGRGASRVSIIKLNSSK